MPFRESSSITLMFNDSDFNLLRPRRPDLAQPNRLVDIELASVLEPVGFDAAAAAAVAAAATATTGTVAIATAAAAAAAAATTIALVTTSSKCAAKRSILVS